MDLLADLDASRPAGATRPPLVLSAPPFDVIDVPRKERPAAGAVPYASDQPAVIVAPGNSGGAGGLADLDRPGLRMAIPEPKTEGVRRVDLVEIDLDASQTGQYADAASTRAPHPHAAAAFVEYLVSEVGLAVYQQHRLGPPSIAASMGCR